MLWTCLLDLNIKHLILAALYNYHKGVNYFYYNHSDLSVTHLNETLQNKFNLISESLVNNSIDIT